MTRKRSALVLLLGVLLVVSTVPGLAAAAVRGEPDLSATVTNNQVSPGEETTLTVTLLNTGTVYEGSARNPGAEQRVMTARGTTLRMNDGGAPITVETGTVGLGSVPDGAAVPAKFHISVDEDADPGRYRVPVVAEYTYTSRITEGNVSYQTDDTTDQVMLVTIEVTDDAQFEVVDTSTTAPVGGSGQVALRVKNVGESAAKDASVSVQSTSGALTFGGSPSAQTYVGTWKPGETRLLKYEASVAPGTEQREIALQTSVNYEDQDGVAHQSQDTTGIQPRSSQQFTVENVTTAAAPGTSGTMSLSLTNHAGQTLDDAVVRLSSPNAALTFGGSPSAQTYVGTWRNGRTQTLPFQVSLADGAPIRDYAVEVSVQYTGESGTTAQSTPFMTGVQPAGEQQFALQDVKSTLQVGTKGEVTATLVNKGPGTARNAVLALSNPGQNVQVGENEYAVGDLAPGESTTVRYDVEVSSSARDGPRQFEFHLQYEDAAGDAARSDPLYLRTDVASEQPAFSVSAKDGSVRAGSSTTLQVDVTNNRNESVSDVSAKLFADSPLSSSDDEAFIDHLAPGETKTIRFEVSASGSAIQKTYPVSMDFQYDNADGDTLVSDTYKLPIQVTERKGGGGILSVAPLGGGLLALLLGGTFVLRR